MSIDDEQLRRVVADFERAKEIVASYLPAIEATFRTAQEAAHLVPDSWFARAIEDAAQATQFIRQMAEQMALERRFMPALATHGWLISPAAPADEPTYLNGLYEDGGVERVDAYLLQTYDADRCGRMVAEISEGRPTFAKWSKTFAKALDAHERGDHELAIPIWLAALDGVCTDELGTRQTYSEVVSRKGRGRLRSHLMPTGLATYEPMLEAWLAVLLGFSVDGSTAGPAVLNRHAILHGRRPDIGSRRDSLQCLIALHVLEYLLRMRDHASKTRRV